MAATVRDLNGVTNRTETVARGVAAADRDRIPLGPDRTRATLEKWCRRGTAPLATTLRTVATLEAAAILAADTKAEAVGPWDGEGMAVGRAMRGSIRPNRECWAASDCLSGRTTTI